MPSVTAQTKESEASDAKSPGGYAVLSPVEDKSEDPWRQTGERGDIELSVIGNLSNYEPIDVDILLEELKVCLFACSIGCHGETCLSLLIKCCSFCRWTILSSPFSYPSIIRFHRPCQTTI